MALRADRESLLIDSPYFPDELEVLPEVLAQAAFTPVGLLATHADYDHLLGRLAFPALPIGVAESTMVRIRSEPGAAQRELREEDARNYVVRPGPLGLGEVQSLPVPGKVEIGEQELELHPADGHTADGMALFAPWCGVLCVGDYLSDVEIPMLSPGGSLRDYRATLALLGTLVERADTVVPGHGAHCGREPALTRLEEDVAYLDALEAGERALPPGRDSARQRAIHAENAERR